jgi:hypothetical protein
MYWCCAQVEPRRERLASYCLGLAGYEIYQPLLREQRRGSHGRKITVTPPLFPGYLFVWVVRGWWDARLRWLNNDVGSERDGRLLPRWRAWRKEHGRAARASVYRFILRRVSAGS